jgi:hypothetical protein
MTEPKPIELPSVQKERLQETDRLTLELAKSNRKTALANAEKAIAQNETAELAYKYIVLQLYMKYGLTEQDAISEQGEILRGGAAKQ